MIRLKKNKKQVTPAFSVKTPLTWVGGKQKQWLLIRKYLNYTPFIDLSTHLDFVVEFYDLFSGGGSVWINYQQWRQSYLQHSPGFIKMPKVYVNDLNQQLIKFFTESVYGGKLGITPKILKHIQTKYIQKDIYEAANLFERDYNKIPKGKSGVDSANAFLSTIPYDETLFFLRNAFNFGGFQKGTPTEARVRQSSSTNKIKNLIRFLEWMPEQENIIFSSKDYREVLDFNDGTPNERKFVFLDPPYEGKAKLYGYDPIIYTDLYKYCCKLNDNNVMFLLTINNSPFIQDLFSKFNIHKQEWKYTSGNTKGKNIKIGKELFITNYPV